jgi:tRNA1(Val) A37 N6-methylase TrmN6
VTEENRSRALILSFQKNTISSAMSKVKMQPFAIRDSSRRYQSVAADKAHGATYTPDNLAQFVAKQIVENANAENCSSLSILDPAIGDGALVVALLNALNGKTRAKLHVRGFDTNALALEEATRRIQAASPTTKFEPTIGNFLDYVLESQRVPTSPSLFSQNSDYRFDLIIANPPYVRTQIMGSNRAQQLADAFGLTGRVDLYQAFLLAMSQVLAPNGVAGMIVSNRFMTTRGGGTLRAALRKRFNIHQVWDFGDTKLFSAAVLPAVIVAHGSDGPSVVPLFSSIYEVQDKAEARAADPVTALLHEGVVEIADGRKFLVRHGTLNNASNAEDVWRLASLSGDEWLSTVKRHTWKQFSEIGKIRVGVKTCADKVFIRHDWDNAFGDEKPELLRTLTTHHGAGRFRAISPPKDRKIVYPHEVVQGVRKPTPLESFPKTRAYLETHRGILESRTYVAEAGRRWYELWVPQDPDAWSMPKLVFRDISAKPTFWIDLDGSVVNGDCYWLAIDQSRADYLWLAAAVANSTFAEVFYDHRFNNKLYSGRRRFITQYVEQFPLPDPSSALAKEIIVCSKAIYDANHSPETKDMERELDELVWQAFGLSAEEV